jgi:hypothetical protein
MADAGEELQCSGKLICILCQQAHRNGHKQIPLLRFLFIILLARCPSVHSLLLLFLRLG